MAKIPSPAAKPSPRRGRPTIQSRLQLALILNSRRGAQGSLVFAGLLVAFGLVVAAAGAVWLLQGGRLGAALGSDANNAQAVAEAGADQIIGVWNAPENRRLLVAGDASPSTWTATNQTSPCLSSTNTRPGAYSGNPSTDARNLVDGNFRSVDDVTRTTGDRQFRLKAIRYSTGSPGSTNRRTIVRTFSVPSGTTTTTVGTIPSGSTFRDLINLDTTSGPVNTGYIAVEVESRVFRNGVQVGTATVTKEFQVLPKCCGGSFGSNTTGGKNFSGTGSLGSDSRYCGVDFGMIVGINGGKFWTYYDNDTYNRFNPTTGKEVPLRNILGVVSNPGYLFQRNDTSNDRGNGCRVIPGPCSTSSDVYTTSGLSDKFLYARITCGRCGTASDQAGTSASGVPIVPLYINGGLPSVDSRFGYTWTPGGRPATNFATANLGGLTIPSSGTSTASTKIRIRTRNDTTPPRVEYCDVATCSSVYDPAATPPTPGNTWAQISLPQGTATGTLTILEDFSSNSFTGAGATGSENRWPDIWVENDRALGGTGVGAGNVLVGSGQATLRYLSGAPSWATLTNRAAIARSVNLLFLQSPYLSFKQTVTGLSGAAGTLEVRYSTSNALPSTDTGWTVLGTTTAGGTFTATAPATGSCTGSGSTRTCRIQLPAAALTSSTKIRFRANSVFSTAQSVAIDDVAITNSTGNPVSIDNWCEYSPTFPATAQFTGGFHCLGPLITMASGGQFIVDTSGGDISFYYNSSTDTRGQSIDSPMIYMASGAELLHVNCANSPSQITVPPSPTGAAVTPQDNCSIGIPNTIYSAVGVHDLLNIFGRDTRPSDTTTQWFRIGSKSTTTGKISGVFLYMPWGSIYLISDQCDGIETGRDATSYNFFGRVWTHDLIACGSNWFLTPPSSIVDTTALGINSNISVSDADFVGWTGVDWGASTSSATLINASL